MFPQSAILLKDGLIFKKTLKGSRTNDMGITHVRNGSFVYMSNYEPKVEGDLTLNVLYDGGHPNEIPHTIMSFALPNNHNYDELKTKRHLRRELFALQKRVHNNILFGNKIWIYEITI